MIIYSFDITQGCLDPDQAGVGLARHISTFKFLVILLKLCLFKKEQVSVTYPALRLFVSSSVAVNEIAKFKSVAENCPGPQNWAKVLSDSRALFSGNETGEASSSDLQGKCWDSLDISKQNIYR